MSYWKGWLLIGSIFIPMIGAFWYLMKYDCEKEEELLRKELPGYAEYAQKVRSRLIPRVW